MILVRDRQPFRTAFELARLGFDAWTVIGLRTLRLGAGGRAASLEAQRMMMEKTATITRVVSWLEAGLRKAAIASLDGGFRAEAALGIEPVISSLAGGCLPRLDRLPRLLDDLVRRR
jgi:hypothetical protein